MVGWQRALKAFSGLCSCSMGSGGCYGAMVHRLAVYDTSVIYSSILLYHCGPCSSEESSRQRLLIDVVSPSLTLHCRFAWLSQLCTQSQICPRQNTRCDQPHILRLVVLLAQWCSLTACEMSIFKACYARAEERKRTENDTNEHALWC
jgi:hypothetical protein